MSLIHSISMKKSVLALVVVCLAGVASANLVTNGSFELGNMPNPRLADGGAGIAAGGTAITGWTVFGSSVDWLQTGTSTNNSSTARGLTPQGGSRFLDLTGFDNAVPHGGVEQTIATVIGAVHDVSFWIGSDSRWNGSKNEAVHFTAAGLSVLTATGTAGGENAWEKFSTSFNATGATTALRFSGVSGVACIASDNVSVTLRDTGSTPVSEPASIALALAALAAWARPTGGVALLEGSALQSA